MRARARAVPRAQRQLLQAVAAGSWAPTTLAWGNDNRTCGFRVVGHGASCRVETRIPGGDVNPYLALAALIAAGLHGIEAGLEAPPPLEGNAYESDAERFPSTLREAIAALESGTVARDALGDKVVDHYLNYGRTEQRLFDQAVTCWERERLFERGKAPSHFVEQAWHQTCPERPTEDGLVPGHFAFAAQSVTPLSRGLAPDRSRRAMFFSGRIGVESAP